MQPQRKFIVKKSFFFFNVFLGELVLVGTWESYKDILMNTSTYCIRRSFWSLFHLQINFVQITFFKRITVIPVFTTSLNYQPSLAYYEILAQPLNQGFPTFSLLCPPKSKIINVASPQRKTCIPPTRKFWKNFDVGKV